MKKHFGITLLAHVYLGVGAAFLHLGSKAGIDMIITLGVFITSVLFYAFAVFTSMEKVKKALYEGKTK